MDIDARKQTPKVCALLLGLEFASGGESLAKSRGWETASKDCETDSFLTIILLLDFL